MIDLFIQRYDRNLLVFLCILTIIGTVMLYSASWYESFSSSNGRTDMLFLQNHLKRLLVGVFFLFGFLTIDYRKLKEIAPYLIALSIILLILESSIFGLGELFFIIFAHLLAADFPKTTRSNSELDPSLFAP